MAMHTQYRKQYKGPSWDDFALNEYNRKKDYRIGRRSVEHRHEPFEWDDSSDSEISDVEFEGTPTNAQPQKQTKRLSSYKTARNGDYGGRDLTGENSKGDVPSVKKAWEISEPNDDERVYSQKATQTTHQKRRKNIKRKKAAKCTKKDREESFVKDVGRGDERVPFVSYGWANDAPIERKYTHNVRANAKDVYPASLRALKRRELDIAKRLQENKKKAQLDEEITREKFFNLRDISPMFMTEYQRSFCNIGGEKTGYVW
ncbi:centriole, cilia and spindle-associated protein-like [Dendronephthya gigantea]|uniref:centriole, cilia and spindle-associated protein-like n=1 Tax=Dendronephthya gigantea TaxID=151771 RepID=UPI00106C17E2|nr:centriole, cilia and spindle-associated protein-like [Dendronephthya gigantea]